MNAASFNFSFYCFFRFANYAKLQFIKQDPTDLVLYFVSMRKFFE